MDWGWVLVVTEQQQIPIATSSTRPFSSPGEDLIHNLQFRQTVSVPKQVVEVQGARCMLSVAGANLQG